jgi:Glucosamine 6-phosphate synthetase, contains amidotransferase and phosphosugar isomerase domains
MKHFAFDDQIASQSEAVRSVLTSSDEIPQLDCRRPVILAGIGTSLHAAKVAGYWIRELSGNRIHPVIVETHDYALHGAIQAEDQIIVISHRGNKHFPRLLLERAKQAGALTISVSGRGTLNPGGDIVLRTCADEQASTHSVSYTTALAVLARLVAALIGNSASSLFAGRLNTIPSAIEKTLAYPFPSDILPRLINKEPLFLTGFGIDALCVTEAALKIKEGAYLWAEGMSIELALHGTPAVFEPRHAAIIAVPDIDDGGRTKAFLTMLKELHIEAVTLGTGDCDLTFAEVDYLLRPFVSILPLQRLVAELARHRGSNPDTTRSDVEPYKSAISRIRL